MAKKSFPIFSYILFLLSTYSNSLKLLNTESKIKFNHDDFEDLDEKVLNYNLPINNKNEEQNSVAILPTSKTLYLKIEDKYYKEKIIIGENRISYFITKYNDNELNIFNSSDIEDKTKFETIISDREKSYIANCRLWKPNNDNLRIICKANNFFANRGYFTIEQVSFIYNEYIINISFGSEFDYGIKNYKIPFLYSERQIIEIKDEIECYNLKFKIEEYDNEILYLYGEVNNSLILDNCQKNENDLNCNLTKEKLEEILVKNNEQFRVEALSEIEGLVKFIGVLNITINYEIDKKEDIYIGINGSLTERIEKVVSFGFTTNVTEMPNIYSDINNNCYFKKFNDNPLLYLCRFDETSEEPFKFGNITDEIVLDNLHYKYNFRIQPFEELYTVNINRYKINVELILTEVLNFTSEDNLNITLIVPSSESLSNIWLNPDSSPLECENLNKMKKCNISVSHFVKKKVEIFTYIILKPKDIMIYLLSK